MQKLQNPISYEGWSIQVYGSDRKLLCSLYPSHAWMFAVGILIGFAIAFVSLNQERPTPQQEASGNASTPPRIEPSSHKAPIKLD